MDVARHAEEAHAWLARPLVFLAEIDGLALAIDRLHRQAQALQFLHQDAEAGRDAGLFNGFALDDRLVGLDAALPRRRT